jgi:DNA processing protein
MITELNSKLLALNKLRGVGPATLRRLVSTPGFASASMDELAAGNSKLAMALGTDGAWAKAIEAAERDILASERSGDRILCVLDDDYPQLLKTTSDPPFFLYVRGNLASHHTRVVAVIGTRNPTEHGAVIARRVSAWLAENGWSIVSGLAIGCDAIAHQTALDSGGHTVAVLAHGLHTIAPKQNEKLAASILDQGGALVTEYPFGIDPIPPHFVKRDRIQAGLARGVIMVQSDLNGGSLHASRAAVEYGRLLAVPIPTDRDTLDQQPKVGANRLLSFGSDGEKTDLLKCQPRQLSLVFIIRSRDDYALLAERLEASR